MKSHCVHTGGGCLRPIERLELWSAITRRQQDALKRATSAAELVLVLWGKMSDEQRESLIGDDQITYLVNLLTSSAYGVV